MGKDAPSVDCMMTSGDIGDQWAYDNTINSEQANETAAATCRMEKSTKASPG
jgi:hypothetical protein